MKKMFLPNWTALCVVVTIIFNLNQAYVFSGDSVPKIRAEKIPPLKKLGRAIFGPKTPVIDDLAQRPLNERVRVSSGVCHPKRRPPEKPRLVAEIPPEKPRITAEIPPEKPRLVAEIPPDQPKRNLPRAVIPSEKPRLVAEIPETVKRERPTAVIPVEKSRIVAEIPPQLPPIINYIKLPCPPDPCIEDKIYNVRSRRAVDYVESEVYSPQLLVDHGRGCGCGCNGSSAPYVVHDNYVPHQPFHSGQPMFVGNHGNQNFIPWQNQGGQNFHGNPHHDGQGQNYDRAMEWGQYVVDTGLGVGYEIGTNAYDQGLRW